MACVEALSLALDQVTSGGPEASAALSQAVLLKSLMMFQTLHVITCMLGNAGKQCPCSGTVIIVAERLPNCSLFSTSLHIGELPCKQGQHKSLAVDMLGPTVDSVHARTAKWCSSGWQRADVVAASSVSCLQSPCASAHLCTGEADRGTLQLAELPAEFPLLLLSAGAGVGPSV